MTDADSTEISAGRDDATQLPGAGTSDATQVGHAEDATHVGTVSQEETQFVPATPGDQDSTLIAGVAEDATQVGTVPQEETQFVTSAAVDQDSTQMVGVAEDTQVGATSVGSETQMTGVNTQETTNTGIPDYIGRYKIEKILGQGAMGVVYKGVDPTLGRPVAIKTILTALLDIGRSNEVLERFKREAQAAGRINHPGIVSVYELDQDGDTCYIAMEFVEGQELEELLNSGQKFRIEDGVKVIDELLDALSVAHEQGVVHRDIKPANIIVTKRGIKVADFGIANLESSSMTQMGEVLGTPNYMSPEQVYGQHVDGRTDLFSVGIILYQLLTGEKPFAGGAAATVMHRVVNNEPDPPSILNKLVPKGFDGIIQKAMAKAPADRYQTAADFQLALKGAFNKEKPAGGTYVHSQGPEYDKNGVPKSLGKYKIEKVLGKGAMGIVYKGLDESINRQVAIKTILTNLLDHAQSEAILERFRREAQAAARISNSHIVAVYEYGKDGDTAFIAMEYVEGQELEELLESGKRLALDTVTQIIGQLLDALGEAHKKGVVHRDIKPANLIFTENGIKVADFGIANLEESSMTQMGEVLGTPNYMSPEQVYGQPVDGRSDLFSVGIILYQLLTGEKPFSGGAAATVMHRVVNSEPEAPSILNQLLPKGYDAIVKKSMAKKPEDRYQTAQDFKDALLAIQAGKAPKPETNKTGLKVAFSLVVVGGIAASAVFFVPQEMWPWYPKPPTPEIPITTIKPVVETPKGYFQISTDPEVGADVFLDGKKIGVTPLRKQLDVGEYEVILSKPNYYELPMDIEVEEGKEQLITDLTLQKM